MRKILTIATTIQSTGVTTSFKANPEIIIIDDITKTELKEVQKPKQSKSYIIENPYQQFNTIKVIEDQIKNQNKEQMKYLKRFHNRKRQTNNNNH